MEKISDFVRRYKWQIALFLILFIMKSYLNTCLYGLVQNTGNDEIGTIAGATLFTEFDWSNVISRANYYGFGYSVLMTPALLLIDDTVLLHQILLVYNTVCICISAVICFNIQCRYFAVKDKKLAFFIALASVTFENNVVMTNVVANESPLILILWTTIALLLYLKEKKDKTQKNLGGTLCLALILIYGLLIHTRIIYIWGTVAVFIALYAIYKRKCMINIPTFLGVFACGYIVANKMIHYVQNTLWKAEEGTVLNNSIQSLSGNLEKYLEVFTWNGFKATVYTALGEIWGMICLTGGVFAFGLVLMLIALVRFRKTEFIECVGENFEFVVITVTALYIAILGSVSLGAANALKEVVAAGEASKWYMYVRYTALVMGPIIMCTLVWLTDKAKNIKYARNYQYGAIFVYIVVQIGFLWKIAPKFIGVKNTGSGEYLNYMALMGMEYGDNFLPVHFIRILVLSSLALGGVILCVKRYKKLFVPIIVIGINFFSFSVVTVMGNSQVSRELYELFYEAEKYVEDEWEMTPENCSISISTSGTSAFINSCQFSFKEWNINLSDLYDEKKRENEIIFSPIDTEDYLFSGYKLAYTNDQKTCFMYIRGAEIEEKAENSNLYLTVSDELNLDRMFTNGEILKAENGFRIYSDEAYVIYGPYSELEAGDYKVTYSFETDTKADLEFQTGVWVYEDDIFEESLSFSTAGNKKESLSYTFSLDKYTKGIEFKVLVPEKVEIHLLDIQIEKIEN